MKSVLVPIDGSANALRAVQYAADRAGTSQEPIEVDLLHVLPQPRTPTVPVAAAEFEPRPEELDQVFAPALALLRSRNVAFRTLWRAGDPADEIVAAQLERPYDALIMGTRGLGPLGNLVFGSVATQVVQRAALPVTLIK